MIGGSFKKHGLWRYHGQNLYTCERKEILLVFKWDSFASMQGAKKAKKDVNKKDLYYTKKM
jgi:hypothetical protein